MEPLEHDPTPAHNALDEAVTRIATAVANRVAREWKLSHGYATTLHGIVQEEAARLVSEYAESRALRAAEEEMEACAKACEAVAEDARKRRDQIVAECGVSRDARIEAGAIMHLETKILTAGRCAAAIRARKTEEAKP